MPNPPPPDALLRLLEEHRASHAMHYGPGNFSDHGPMVYLAMHALGLGMGDIERFARGYRTRLSALPESALRVGAHDWLDSVGQKRAYPAFVRFFDAQIQAHGFRATLSEYLPRLISGWVKDAFHPLIRLGYGIEFEVPSEIAAGLAYLACVGDDPALALAADRPSVDERGRDFLLRLRSHSAPSSLNGPGPFNRRYEQALGASELWPAGGGEQVYGDLSRASLELFDATHDFFALHLVTASHAFPLCAPFAGPNAARVFSVGIGATYLALGSPSFQPLSEAAPAAHPFPLEVLATSTDEHELKLAHVCRASAQAFDDPTYEAVLHRYLEPRLKARA